jgi:integrase
VTVEKYSITIRHFSRFLCRSAQVSDLEEDGISEFLSLFSESHQPWTVTTARKHLLALANYAHRKGLVCEVPDVMRVKLYGRLPEAYTIEEISRLVAAARHVQGFFSGVPGSLFFPALFLVAYDTGGRAGVIWAMRWTDYRPDGPALLLAAEYQKNRREQLLRISNETAIALEKIRSPERELIFDLGRCSQMRYYYVKKILKAAGLPCGRRDQLQRIRRTTLSLFHEMGGDATAQAGHSSDVTTRRHYLDTSNLIQAADILPRPMLSDRQRRLF